MALIINGRMKVKTLRADFLEEFGLTLRVYDGRSFADDDATLASIRKGDNKGGEFAPRKNTKVGNLEDKILELFGIKTQVAGSDDSYLCDNDLTLTGALEADTLKMKRKEQKESKAQTENSTENEDGGQQTQFEPNFGKIIHISELAGFLAGFANLKFDKMRLTNTVYNAPDFISGGESQLIQLFGTRDNGEIIILSFLHNEKVWVSSDEMTDALMFEEYPEYIVEYSPDIINNNFNWKKLGMSDERSVYTLFGAVEEILDSSLEELADEGAGLIYDFEYENSECEKGEWRDSLDGLDPYGLEDEDIEEWTYAGFWIIEVSSIDITVQNGKFILDDGDITDEHCFDEVYSELGSAIFDMAWGADDDRIKVGAGYIKHI